MVELSSKLMNSIGYSANPNPTITLPYCLDKHYLIHVRSEDDNIHVSWELPDGKIIAFESYSCMENSFPSALLVWDKIEEYIKCISDCNWIIYNAGLVQCVECSRYEFIHRTNGWVGIADRTPMCSNCHSLW